MALQRNPSARRRESRQWRPPHQPPTHNRKVSQSEQLPAGLNMCYVVIIMSVSVLAVLHQNISTSHSIIPLISQSLWLSILLLIHNIQRLSLAHYLCIVFSLCMYVASLFVLSSRQTVCLLPGDRYMKDSHVSLFNRLSITRHCRATAHRLPCCTD